MKKIFIVLIISISLVSCFAALAQGISVESSQIKLNSSTFIYPFNNTDPSIRFNGIHPTSKPTFSFLHNFSFIGSITGSYTNDLQFYTNQGYQFQVLGNSNFYTTTLRIAPTTGNVGIKTVSEPTSALEVNGFTKLGSDAPAIKVKKLTGTSSALQGGTSSVPHGLTASKILNVSVILDFGTNTFIPSSYNYNTGYEFDWYSDATNIIVVNKSNNSGSILSKPFKILITYEE